MSRRSGVIIAGLVLAVVAVWWWRRPEPTTAVEATQAANQDFESRRAARYARSGEAEPPAAVSGRVVDPDGAPVAGALVELREMSLEAAATSATDVGMRHSARTADDGRYRVEGLRPGTYSASASARGFAPAMRKGLTVRPSEDKSGVDLTLARGGHLLSGTVTDIGGGPVAGAVIRVNPWFEGSLVDMFFVSYSTVTDENGAYEIYLRNGRYGVSAQHPDYSREREGVQIADGPRRLDFRLIPGGIIRGRVVRAGSGEPVSGAFVIDVGRSGGFVVSGPSEWAATSDGDGRFEMRGLAPRSYRLAANGRGFRTNDPVQVDIGLAEEVDGVEIVVDSAYTISGFVVEKGDRDKPVAGALVGAYNLRPGAFLVAPRRTEADGYFEIHGVPSGFYNVGVLADERVPQVSGASANVESADVNDLIVEVDAGATIRGRVEPAVAARITSEIDPESVSFLTIVSTATKALINGRADDRGEFVLRGIGSGKLRLVASADDGRTGKIDLDVGADDVDGVVIKLEPRPVLSGRVVDAAGQPVSDVSVSAQAANRSRGFRFDFGRDRGTPVQQDGTFAILGLDPGTYEVSVEGSIGDLKLAGDKESIEVELTEDGKDDLILEVPRMDGVITGTVSGEVGPVADAMVRVIGERSWQGEVALTDETGRFEVAGLPVGTYRVEVTGPKGIGYGENPEVKTGSSITIDLRSYSTLAVTLSKPDEVGCVATSAGPTRRREAVAGAGPVTFTRLEAGDYSVTVSCESAFGRTDDIKIEPGDAKEIAVALGSFSVLTGRLLGKDGEPMSGVAIMVQPQGGEFSPEDGANFLTGNFPRTSGDGRFRVDRVKAGSGKLFFFEGTFAAGGHSADYTIAVGDTKDLGDITYDPKRPDQDP